MPTYRYHCNDCRHVFEVIEHISARPKRPPACPKCKSKDVEQDLSASYVKTVRKS